MFINEYTDLHGPVAFVVGLGPEEGQENANLGTSVDDEALGQVANVSELLRAQFLEPLGDTEFAQVRLKTRLRKRFLNLPRRKINSPAIYGTEKDAETPRSPLSPLNPGSPLYPDGIMTPLWVTKYQEDIPGSILLVLPIFKEESGAPGADGTPIEKAHDQRLAMDILDKRKSAEEHGIPLCVLLVCSKTLESEEEALQARVGWLRKNTGTESRTTLYFLVSDAMPDLDAFVERVKHQLLKLALGYYGEKIRRTQRKGVRGNGVESGLSERAWQIRSFFKLATLHEMRSEYDVALKFYGECYEEIQNAFYSLEASKATPEIPSALSPNRVEETRSLADSVMIKMVLLNFLENNGPVGIAAFRGHLESIGGAMKEHMAWRCAQMERFAHLVRVATAQTMIPVGVAASPHYAVLYHMQQGIAVLPESAFSPATAVQCAGAYFLEASRLAQELGDHDLALELLAQGYDAYGEVSHAGAALYVAFEMGNLHMEDNGAVAHDFFSKLALTFQKSSWAPLSSAMLEFTSAAAGAVSPAALAKALAEVLCVECGLSSERAMPYAMQLGDVLADKSLVLAAGRPRPGEDGVGVSVMFASQFSFWSPRRTKGAHVPFQVRLSLLPAFENWPCTLESVTLVFLGRDKKEYALRVAVDELNYVYKAGCVTLGGGTKVESGTKAAKDDATYITGAVSSDVDITLSHAKIAGFLQGSRIQVVTNPEPLRLWKLASSSTLGLREPTLGLRQESLAPQFSVDVTRTSHVVLSGVEANIGEIHVQNTESSQTLNIHVAPRDAQEYVKLHIARHPACSLGPGERASFPIVLLSALGNRDVQLELRVNVSCPYRGTTATRAESLSVHVEGLFELVDTHIDVLGRAEATPLSETAHVERLASPWEQAWRVAVRARVAKHAGAADSVHVDKTSMEIMGGGDNNAVSRIVSQSPVGGRHALLFAAAFVVEVSPRVRLCELRERSYVKIEWTHVGTSHKDTSWLLVREAAWSPLVAEIGKAHWSRHGGLYADVEAPPVASVHAEIPVHVVLNNTALRVRRLSFQVETSADFVFEGPRRLTTRTVLAPLERRVVSLSLRAVRAGALRVPAVVVHEHMHLPEAIRRRAVARARAEPGVVDANVDEDLLGDIVEEEGGDVPDVPAAPSIASSHVETVRVDVRQPLTMDVWM